MLVIILPPSPTWGFVSSLPPRPPLLKSWCPYCLHPPLGSLVWTYKMWFVTAGQKWFMSPRIQIIHLKRVWRHCFSNLGVWILLCNFKKMPFCQGGAWTPCFCVSEFLLDDTKVWWIRLLIQEKWDYDGNMLGSKGRYTFKWITWMDFADLLERALIKKIWFKIFLAVKKG